jgi:cytosine/adenosine deaminase-related metal-dependent hydrolase
VRALQEAGIRVGLGADGAACNNRLDPWLEMRQAAFVQSALRGPGSVDPDAILRLATLGGAEALRIESETGSLAAGKWADLIVIDPVLDPGASPGPLDQESPAAWLVYAGSASLVRETWARGRPIYQIEEESDWRKEWFQRLIRARRTLHARAERFGARGATSNRASHP